MVKEYIESRENQVNIFEMKHHFKVSIQALYMSLHRYGYVNQKQYQSFWKKVNSNGWNKEEPSPIPHRPIEEKNDRLVTSLKKLYLSDEMSVNRIGEVLNLNQMDTRKLIKGWGALIDQYEKL
jgi:Zn-dependent peptidase ImmA (M78 family)